VGGLGFLANLLEWALTSYLEAFELLEADLEEIDTEAMSGQVSSAEHVLARLVEMRREVGRLRRALVEHREVVLALTRPELEAISSSDSAERFASLRERLEDAIQASRDTRESIVGSFDVLQASTTRRMNEIMKVLTLASVLLLPGALIAGIMGMNFEVGLFDTAAYFWAVIALIVAVAVTTLVVARAREWI
jgi:magnesium transporter